MKAMLGKEKFVITNRLLVDAASGKKLSKTEGSLVNLDDEPNDMFGKVMAIPDEMIPYVAELSTEMPMDEIKQLGKEKNPRDAKLALAYEIVRTYHSEKEAEKARENWIKTFSEKEAPEDAKKLKVKREISVLDLLLAAGVESKSEARRLVNQKAVKIDDAVKDNPDEILKLKGGEILKVGKHRFFKIL